MSNGDGELRGIGGWLAFFLVVMGVFSPIRVVATMWTNLYQDPQVAAAYGPAWPTLELVEWIIAGLTIAGCWLVVGRMILVKNWTSVRIMILGIWVLAIGTTFVELIAVSWIAGIPFEQLSAGVVMELARPVFFCLIWTGYLMKSERVANTYNRDGLDQEVAEVFH
jgi:hypothetical protein